MNANEVVALLRDACQAVVDGDPELFKRKRPLSEPCRTARLAMQLERLAAPYEDGRLRADVEFNRDGEAERSGPDGHRASTDLVLHVRGPGGPNVLAIEAKRGGGGGLSKDRERLAALLKPGANRRAFDHAAQVIFSEGTPRIRVRWIRPNAEIDEALSFKVSKE